MTVRGRVAPVLVTLVLAGMTPGAARAEATDNPSVAASVDSAQSDLAMSMPRSAKDKTEVAVRVSWHRVTDDVPVTEEVALQRRRRGTKVWDTIGSIDVADGGGAIRITPRDDADFRVTFAGDQTYRAVTSAAIKFDNIPTKDLRMRVGQYNLPGGDKLPKASTRAVKAAKAIRRADLDVVTLNELVGPGHDSRSNKPSSFAASVRKALGSKWRLITPTMTYNENYIAYRPDRVSLNAHYADRVIPGIGKGRQKRLTARHITPVLFKDRGSNQPFLVVGTHLVSGNRAGARRQAYSVGHQAGSLSSRYPIVVSGDMNTSDRMKGLTDQGLKDARRAADHRTNPTYATYMRYSARKPRKDTSAVIDRIYVPRKWTVHRWTTVRGTSHGSFTRPRASDHLLVWSSMTGPHK